MTGADVGKKLGSPVNYEANKNATQQQEQGQQQSKASTSKVTPNMGSAGNSMIVFCSSLVMWLEDKGINT